MNGFPPENTHTTGNKVADKLESELRIARQKIVALENQVIALQAGDPEWKQRFEKELRFREKQQLVRDILEVAKFPIFVIDENDHIEIFNPAFAGYFLSKFLEEKEILYLYEVFPQEICTHIQHSRIAFEKGEQGVEFEWHRLEAASEDYLKFSLFPMRDSDQSVYALSVWVDDISYLKETQTQQALSESRFRNLVQKTDNLVVRLNRNLCIDFANPAAQKTLGLGSEREDAVYFPDLIHAGDSASVERKLLEAAANQETRLSFEYRLPPKAGESAFYLWTLNFDYNADGDLLCVNLIAKDITARRSLEFQMQRAVETAEAADRSKSEFLAMISHEIRTPLNSIIGLSNLMERGDLGAEERQMIEIISSSGQSLLALINDVLDFSKVDADNVTLAKANTNVSECLQHVVRLFQFRAEAKGVQLQSTVLGEVPNWVFCDQERVIQVLNNLVGNAVKFTETGFVHVRLRCERLTNVEELDLWSGSRDIHFSPFRFYIEVEDSGIGISPEQRILLFQPFSQADPSIRRRFGGTGLGLVISRKLAKLMGGDITLRSEYGVGSTFTFSFVADASETTENHNGASEREPSHQNHADYDESLAKSHPLSILVVDDVAHNRLVMKTLLVRMGYHPHMADGGMSALKILENNRCDLVFMDMLMPDMSGIETVREIRLLQHDGHMDDAPIRIVALTANATEQDRVECAEAGMEGFISKPIRFSEIQTCIEETYTLLNPQLDSFIENK